MSYKLEEVKKLIRQAETLSRDLELRMAKLEGQIFSDLAEFPKDREARMEQLYREKSSTFVSDILDIADQITKINQQKFENKK